jgi:hypothetical protein
MKACEVGEEKKRKRAMPGPSEGSSSGAPPKYRMIYTPPTGQPALTSTIVLGQPPTAAAYPPSSSTAAAVAGSQPPQQLTPIGYPCYNCEKIGRFAKDCHRPKQSNAPRFPTIGVNQHRGQQRGLKVP